MSCSEVIVLCGGLNTRLREILGARCKAMAPILGKPFLYWLLKSLRQRGFKSVILATGYQHEQIEAYFRTGACVDLNLHYSVEDIPHGTGGALIKAAEHVLGEHVYVLNGDSFTPWEPETLYRQHIRHHASITLWLVQSQQAQSKGRVIVNKDGKIIEFNEKQHGQRHGLINAGIYLFRKDFIESFPKSRYLMLETTMLSQAMPYRLYGVSSRRQFIDIGTPEDYAKAEHFLTPFFQPHTHVGSE